MSSRPVLIADTPEQLSEARLRLARVGIEAERGYLEGGVAGWKGAGFDLATLHEITVQELQQRLAKNGMQVLDVRREAEFMAGHIEEAAWWPLDRFRISPPEVDLNVPLAVHCQSGYRSMIACSLLQRAGFKNVVNVSGGFGAWQEAKLPVATGAPVSGLMEDAASAPGLLPLAECRGEAPGHPSKASLPVECTYQIQ